MRYRIILVLSVVLAGFMAPSPSAAVFYWCPDCGIYGLGPDDPCTCPGTGPHPYWRYSTCGTYPAGCIESSAQSDLEEFLSTLATSPDAPASDTPGDPEGRSLSQSVQPANPAGR